MNFWAVHSAFFLMGLVFFPRLTVILFSHVTGGPIFWIFFLVVPRLVIPILAAYHYWDTNPILVVLSILICLGGETGEKTVVKRTIVVRRRD